MKRAFTQRPSRRTQLFFRLIFTVAVAMCLSTVARSQSFVGLGIGYGLPTTQLEPVATGDLRIAAQYGVHRYCNIWPVLTLQYDHFLERNDASVLRTAFTQALALQGHLRWFPWGSTTLPLYGAVGTGLSVISGDDDASTVGMTGTLGVGFLLNYDSPCCDWFLDLQVNYQAMNMLRDETRPHLSALGATITFNLPLGGSR